MSADWIESLKVAGAVALVAVVVGLATWIWDNWIAPRDER